MGHLIKSSSTSNMIDKPANTLRSIKLTWPINMHWQLNAESAASQDEEKITLFGYQVTSLQDATNFTSLSPTLRQ